MACAAARRGGIASPPDGYQGQEQEWARRPFKWHAACAGMYSNARCDDVRNGRRPPGNGREAWDVGRGPSGPWGLPDVVLRVRDGGDRQQPRRRGPRRLLYARGGRPPDDAARRGHDQEGEDVANPLLDPQGGADQRAGEAAWPESRGRC